jgi:flagellar M-ring protein FliF
VFIRESQKPSASVLVTMYPGRTLDAAQVSGIVHLVSSSVPELSARHVTVIDQAGALLTGPSAEGASAVLDAAQLKYLHQVEAAIVQRIENILRPIVGPDNVRAQVAATLDFSQVEQTSETFKPNSSPADQAVRSQQSSESASATPQAPQGVPGALSNQPPGAASAPLVAPPGAQPGAQAPLPPATSSQKEQTVNFEVDKTIRHTKGEVGTIQRLSVAVVVNYRRVVEADAVRMQPLSEQEMAQVTDLVREAMGFNKERGDTVNVVNTPFQAALEAEPGVELPLWKDPENVTLAKDLGKTLLMAIVGLYLFFGVLRPTLRDLVRLGQPLEPVPAGAGAAGGVAVAEGTGAPPPAATGAAEAESGYEVDLAAVREMAKQQPEAVAAMVRKWLAPK